MCSGTLDGGRRSVARYWVLVVSDGGREAVSNYQCSDAARRQVHPGVTALYPLRIDAI